MRTANLQVIGSAHRARFGESFETALAAAIDACANTARAEIEFDELGLLGVLAHYAAAGHYEPEVDRLTPGWALQPDREVPRIRYHQYVIHSSSTVADVFVFNGVTISADQTVISTVTALSQPQ